MPDLPANVDLQWLGRQFLAMRVIRIDAALTALLWEEYGGLRRRVAALERDK
jgi:hypothetical protein